MNKKKGLSREFTRDVKSSDKLEPSGFKVEPRVFSRVDVESPIETIRREKLLYGIEPIKVIKPVEKEPDKEKIKAIVDKINQLKKQKEEKAATPMPTLPKQQNVLVQEKAQGVQGMPAKKVSIEDQAKLPGMDQSKKTAEEKKKIGFFKRFVPTQE